MDLIRRKIFPEKKILEQREVGKNILPVWSVLKVRIEFAD